MRRLIRAMSDQINNKKTKKSNRTNELMKTSKQKQNKKLTTKDVLTARAASTLAMAEAASKAPVYYSSSNYVRLQEPGEVSKCTESIRYNEPQPTDFGNSRVTGN